MSTKPTIKGVVIEFNVGFSTSEGVTWDNTYKDFTPIKDITSITKHFRLIHEIVESNPNDYHLTVRYDKKSSNQMLIQVEQKHVCKNNVDYQTIVDIYNQSALQAWTYLERKPNSKIGFQQLREGPLVSNNKDTLSLLDYLEEETNKSVKKGKAKQAEQTVVAKKTKVQSTKTKPTKTK